MAFIPAAEILEGATPAHTVYVLHGILATRRTWRSFGRRLVDSRPDLRLLLVDHRGHGQSRPAPPPHTIAGCAQDLVALAGKYPPAAVIGHSFGGKVGLAFADLWPARLQTWLIDSPPGTAGLNHEVEAVVAALRRVPQPMTDRQQVSGSFAGAGLHPSLVAWMSTNLGPSASGGLEWQFDLEVVESLLESYRALDLWPKALSPSRGEVHLVRGARSDRWSHPDLERFQTLPSEFRHVLPAGHWVQVDAADALLRLLETRLLQDSPSAPA